MKLKRIVVGWKKKLAGTVLLIIVWFTGFVCMRVAISIDGNGLPTLIIAKAIWKLHFSVSLLRYFFHTLTMSFQGKILRKQPFAVFYGFTSFSYNWGVFQISKRFSLRLSVFFSHWTDFVQYSHLMAGKSCKSSWYWTHLFWDEWDQNYLNILK